MQFFKGKRNYAYLIFPEGKSWYKFRMINFIDDYFVSFPNWKGGNCRKHIAFVSACVSRPFRLTILISLITNEYIHFFHSRSCAIQVLENICIQCSPQRSHGVREGMFIHVWIRPMIFSWEFIYSLFITSFLLSYKWEHKYVGII